MVRKSFAAFLLAGSIAMPAAAEDITIGLPSDVRAERFRVEYGCGDLSVAAEYVNAGPVSLVVLRFREDVVVAANVMAASGAKYAGGQYVWWTKGDEATLYDLMKGEADRGISCKPNR